MASPGTRKHFLGIGAVALVVTGGGWLLGEPLLAFLGFLAAYGLWSLLNTLRLREWLNDPDREAPRSFGLWSQTFDQISKLRKSSQKKKMQYRSVIQDFQSLTDALPDATLVLDQQGNITWFNNTAQQMLSLKTPGDLGQPVTNLLRGPDFSDWLAIQNEVKSKLEMPSPHDENVWLSIFAVDYRKNQRLLILRDVTQVHNINQVRRDFVANISHELRTPLTVLIGYLEMLRESEPDTAKMVDKMQAQARQMEQLLGDLLELSRVQNNVENGDDEIINVPAMLAQLHEQMDEISQGRHEISVHAETGLQLAGITSDIESTFRNLIINAVNYTPAGGKIDIRWESGSEGATFSVTDTGIGIPKRDIPRLTERFYRVASDRSRSTGGTGLGLAIVKHVLNAHQARLQIESELGEGSRFRCIFPKARVRRNGEHPEDF